jgi:hypothetical protein
MRQKGVSQWATMEKRMDPRFVRPFGIRLCPLSNDPWLPVRRFLSRVTPAVVSWFYIVSRLYLKGEKGTCV